MATGDCARAEALVVSALRSLFAARASGIGGAAPGVPELGVAALRHQLSARERESLELLGNVLTLTESPRRQTDSIQALRAENLELRKERDAFLASSAPEVPNAQKVGELQRQVQKLRKRLRTKQKTISELLKLVDRVSRQNGESSAHEGSADKAGAASAPDASSSEVDSQVVRGLAGPAAAETEALASGGALGVASGPSADVAARGRRRRQASGGSGRPCGEGQDPRGEGPRQEGQDPSGEGLKDPSGESQDPRGEGSEQVRGGPENPGEAAEALAPAAAPRPVGAESVPFVEPGPGCGSRAALEALAKEVEKLEVKKRKVQDLASNLEPISVSDA